MAHEYDFIRQQLAYESHVREIRLQKEQMDAANRQAQMGLAGALMGGAGPNSFAQACGQQGLASAAEARQNQVSYSQPVLHLCSLW